jgi:hypothetical protein
VKFEPEKGVSRERLVNRLSCRLLEGFGKNVISSGVVGFRDSGSENLSHCRLNTFNFHIC